MVNTIPSSFIFNCRVYCAEPAGIKAAGERIITNKAKPREAVGWGSPDSRESPR